MEVQKIARKTGAPNTMDHKTGAQHMDQQKKEIQKTDRKTGAQINNRETEAKSPKLITETEKRQIGNTAICIWSVHEYM